MRRAVAVTRGEWAVLSVHLPGYAKSIGVVLRDTANDGLYIQVQKQWWHTWDEDVEICCEIIEQIRADARDHGASAAVDRIDGSHVIRLSERRKIWIADYNKAIRELDALGLAGGRSRRAARARDLVAGCEVWEWRRLLSWWNNVPVFRYSYQAAILASVLVMAVSFFAFIAPKPPQIVRTIQDFPTLPLTHSEITMLQVSDTPQRAHARHRTALKPRAIRRRKFKGDILRQAILAKRHTVSPQRFVSTPPRYVAVSYAVNSEMSLLLPPLPSPGKFRKKHNRFVRALIAIGGPFRDSQKSASNPI